MQKIILILVTSICLISVTGAQERIKIDTTKSVVKWTGSNLFKYNKHFGTVVFLSGEVIKSNGKIIGGNFAIDMNSISNTDGGFNEMLVLLHEINKTLTSSIQHL